MKTYYLLVAIAILFTACNRTTPKQTASEFVKKVYMYDFDHAADLTTADTRQMVAQKQQGATQPAGRVSDDAINKFQLDSLREQVKGNSAVVESDGIRLSLVKEGNQWKVLASEQLIDDIANRTEKEDVLSAKWVMLQNAFDNRMQAVKEYVQYLSTRGGLKAEGQELLQIIANTSLAKNFTKTDLQEYLNNQRQIDRLIDRAIVPSFSAGADMSVNLILRVNEAESSIKQAKAAYNLAAQDLWSKTYVPHVE